MKESNSLLEVSASSLDHGQYALVHLTAFSQLEKHCYSVLEFPCYGKYK